MHPSMYNRPGHAPPGLDFNKANSGLTIFGSQGGPMTAIQDGQIKLSDGTPLPDDVNELERKGIRLSSDARRAVASLKTEKLIAAERHQSEQRIRELQEQEFTRLEGLRVQTEDIERQRWTIPDLPGFSGGYVPSPPMPSPFEGY